MLRVCHGQDFIAMLFGPTQMDRYHDMDGSVHFRILTLTHWLSAGTLLHVDRYVSGLIGRLIQYHIGILVM